MNRTAFIAPILGIVLFAGIALADSIDTTDYNYLAWGENIGWLNWGTTEGDVFVPDATTDGELTGYVWGENVGWISLNCSNTSSCGTVAYRASRSQGEILGYAWGENVGWINFNCSNDASCGTVDFGVEIATTSGEFSGYAWGENVGWINFNCSNDASCGTVDFKVLATATATPTPTGGGGSGGYIISPSPTSTTSPIGPPASATPPVSTTVPTPTSIPVTPPTPVVSPPTSPPPSVLPPAPPPPGPGPIGGIGGRVFDRILENPVEAGAGLTIALGLIPLLLAFLEAAQTQALGALGYSFFQAVGLRKKARVWGTVYDTGTKRPIPYARVQIVDAASRVLETRFADRDGRYGFLLSTPGTREEVVLKVRITASKEGFSFPTQRVGEGTDYIVYEHPYHGEMIEVTTDTALTYDLPMDPTTATATAKRPPFLAVINASTEQFLNLGFFAGLVLVPWNLIRHPNTLNIVIAVVFVVANLVRMFMVYRPYGHVREATTGELLPFALVTLHDESGVRKAFSVSDERGRYFLTAKDTRPQILKAQTPANYSPSRTASFDIAGDSRALRRGWVTKDIKV